MTCSSLRKDAGEVLEEHPNTDRTLLKCHHFFGAQGCRISFKKLEDKDFNGHRTKQYVTIINIDVTPTCSVCQNRPVTTAYIEILLLVQATSS